MTRNPPKTEKRYKATHTASPRGNGTNSRQSGNMMTGTIKFPKFQN